ncbi:MAG: hypothetical protein ACXVHP_08465, partial [Methanobacterium sp.]
WYIISKLRCDRSYWHHLEPAEIMEIVQRIKEGKEKIWGWDKYIRLDLRLPLRKLNFMRSHLHIMGMYNVQKMSSS